jgi:MFS family permease
LPALNPIAATSVIDLGNSGAFIVDPLNHYFGRRGEIFITACCLTATPIGSGFAKSWQGLFAARFVLGIGIGAKNATVPIYSAEMAPARIRGALVMFWQLWVVAGELLLVARPETLANGGLQVSSWASPPTSLSKTLVVSLGVFNSVQPSSHPSSSAVVSGFVPSPLVGS